MCVDVGTKSFASFSPLYLPIPLADAQVFGNLGGSFRLIVVHPLEREGFSLLPPCGEWNSEPDISKLLPRIWFKMAGSRAHRRDSTMIHTSDSVPPVHRYVDATGFAVV